MEGNADDYFGNHAMICAAKVIAMVRKALYRERAAAFATAALLLLSSPLHAQEDCIQLDYADTLDWSGMHPSELMLANHTYMVTRPPSDDFYGFLVRGAGSDCLKQIFADYASIVDTCQDIVSDRVYTILKSGAGQHFDIHIWSVDPETDDPVQEYVEGWCSEYSCDGKERELVGADGQCLWKDRKASRHAVDDAVRALRIGDMYNEAVILRDVQELPVRPLDSDEVQRLLLFLDGAATLEGAVYASPVDRAQWRVVQIRGDALCNANGVVLVLNRRTEQWFSIYDIASGCSKSLDFPFYGIHVHDGNLTVSACHDCSYWGEYSPYVINLETWRVRILELDEHSEWDPSDFDHENPSITDVQQDLFAE